MNNNYLVIPFYSS